MAIPAVGPGPAARPAEGLRVRDAVRVVLVGLPAFVIGAAVSTLWFVSVLGNSLELPDELPQFLFLVSFVGPVVEEYVKVLPLATFRGPSRRRLRGDDWIVLGAVSGLAFGAAEGVFYVATTDPSGRAMQLLYRVALGLPLHALAATLSGRGFAQALELRRARRFFPWFAAAVTLHGLNNGLEVLVEASQGLETSVWRWYP